MFADSLQSSSSPNFNFLLEFSSENKLAYIISSVHKVRKHNMYVKVLFLHREF
jgi:hypothetical protein